MAHSVHETETMWDDRVIRVEYNPLLPEFGPFLEIRGDDGSDALVEIERKKARKLAKAILKMTKKRSKK